MLPKGIDVAVLNRVIDVAISEDVGSGDITSLSVIPKDTHFKGTIVSREPVVCAGLPFLDIIFSRFSNRIVCDLLVKESEHIGAGTKIANLNGPALELLSAERVAINFIQHLSGIATLTRKYVETIKGTGAILLDTRKTIPGLRALAKYATAIGGAENHRMGLSDGVLIKDNHIAVSGGVTEAVRRAKAANLTNIEVECDTIQQVKEALDVGADRILLDNMNAETCLKAVRLISGRVPTEASGDISLETIRSIAETGVTYISVGRLTHSARAVNLGLDWNITASMK